jgi:AcrR family transcriptional regulator
LASHVEPAPAASDALPGRRERRKAETRRRLLEAARRLFVERGYDATRPQDIARTADVAAGTFYLHFADKREAFVTFTDEAAGELMEHIRERARSAAGFADRLASSLEALFDYADAHPGVLGAAFADGGVIAEGLPVGASLRDRLAHNLAQGLRQGMAQGEIRDDYDAHVIAHGIVGMIQAACVHGSGRGADRQALIENLTRFCGRALVASSPPESSP